MENNKALKTIISVLVIVVFALGGFYFGKKTAETENLMSAHPEPVKQPEKEETNTNTDTEEVTYNIPDNCKKMESELNFSTDIKKMYCTGDICAVNFERIEKILKENPNYNYNTFELIDDKIYSTNNEDSTKINFSFVPKNIKTFRVHFSVQSGMQLYVLDSENKLYRWDLGLDYYGDEEMVGDPLIYSDVKDFDVFEGHDYGECIKKWSEGQEIEIALHTNSGKFVIIDTSGKTEY